MKNIINTIWGGAVEENNSQQSEEGKYLSAIDKAKSDWHAAQNYFENVSDPDLVDYAIYQVEAARRRYMFLLKKAKEMNLVKLPQTHEGITDINQ